MPESFNAGVHLLDRHLAAGDGDRIAVTGPAGTLSYAELTDLAARVGGGLAGLSVRPEQRVAMVMSDGPELLAAILGTMRIGAVAVPINTMLTAAELATIIADTRARVVLATAEFAETVALACQQAPEVTTLVVAGDAAPLAPVVVRPFAEMARADPAEPYDTWADSPALWLYTSGTTGTPKGAMHRHASIRHVCETYGEQVLGITPGDRCYSVAKLFFAYGLGNSAFFPLSVGASVVLDPARPTPPGAAERIDSYRPTLFFAVPSFYAALLNAGLPAGMFDRTRLGVSAGEALPAHIFRRMRDEHGLEVLDGLGSTEALHIFVSNRPGQVIPGSSGTPVPGYEVRLLDDAGEPVEDEEPGNLYVRGPSVALGYWCRYDVSRQVFQGEWLRTGDTYLRAKDGSYTCLGRASDMIKSGGIWVSPSEVEARLLEHPAVAAAAVVGLDDTEGLERPVACVVRVPGATVTPEELVDFCRAGLAGFKRPHRVLFVDSLPTTATGKLKRYAVRDEARGRLTR